MSTPRVCPTAAAAAGRGAPARARRVERCPRRAERAQRASQWRSRRISCRAPSPSRTPPRATRHAHCCGRDARLAAPDAPRARSPAASAPPPARGVLRARRARRRARHPRARRPPPPPSPPRPARRVRHLLLVHSAAQRRRNGVQQHVRTDVAEDRLRPLQPPQQRGGCVWFSVASRMLAARVVERPASREPHLAGRRCGGHDEVVVVARSTVASTKMGRWMGRASRPRRAVSVVCRHRPAAKNAVQSRPPVRSRAGLHAGRAFLGNSISGVAVGVLHHQSPNLVACAFMPQSAATASSLSRSSVRLSRRSCYPSSSKRWLESAS